ncbi:MAG: NADH-quinone oxidoreductase subunit G [Nitrospinota bacterium]|nr:MAG: NADH-quinone oxidoreductase subunit G [Nitrospinota bacterium]
MPKLIIDGQEIEVEKGTTIMRAAEALGIEIPRYCYHPGLSIAGSCRLCQVEVEGQRKLQIACNTQVTDGMVVHTDTEKVQSARRGILEFLLSNHPLDCPVCDQAGECWLQDYYMVHGLYESRFIGNKRKLKKAFPIGPHVMLDQERCILCSRCVRFCREIAGVQELGIFARGNQAVIDVFPGKQLENRYSGNVVDICPVGALTDRDFRFQCRVWYLERGNSICPGCSTGCNIEVHYNIKRPYKAQGRRVLRLKPRFNPAVNSYWMCDEGRYGYKFIDAEDRLLQPQRRKDASSPPQPQTWEEVLPQVAATIRQTLQTAGPGAIGVLASPQLTNEELFLVKQLFQNALKVPHLDFRVPEKREVYSDNFLIRADKNPNTCGANIIGLLPAGQGYESAEMLEQAGIGKIKVLYVFGHDLVAAFGEERVQAVADAVDMLVFQGSNANGTARHAHVILPSATFVEKEGTFTNYQGRVQRIQKILDPLGMALADWEILQRLASALDVHWSYRSSEEIFQDLASQVPPFAGLTYARIADQGVVLREEG